MSQNPNKSKQNNNKQSNKSTLAGGKRKNQGNRRRRRRNARRNNGLSQSMRVTRSEVLGTGTFSVGSVLVEKRFIFDPLTGPPWFKAMCNLYEKYKVHGAKLKLVFGGSKMTKGVYVLSYNTNFSQINLSQSYERWLSQRGAKEITAANQTGVVNIAASGITGFGTVLPTSGAEGYAFDACVAGVPPEEVTFTLHVIYDVTFYNPQCIN